MSETHEHSTHETSVSFMIARRADSDEPYHTTYRARCSCGWLSPFTHDESRFAVTDALDHVTSAEWRDAHTDHHEHTHE